MCVRHTASFKNNYRRRPITTLFNTPQKKDNDSETPVRVKQNVNKKNCRDRMALAVFRYD